MSETTVVNGIELKEGTIYLRHKVTGQILQYEELLAQMSHMEKFEYTGTLPERPNPLALKGSLLSAQERAEDFDRLAEMTNEKREAELARRAAYNAQQEQLTAEVESQPKQPETVVMLDEKGPTYQSYVDNGWTNQQLVDNGLAKFA